MLPFRIPAENASVSEQSRLVAPRSHENNNYSNGEVPNAVSPSSYGSTAESPARSLAESPTESTDEESFSSRPRETKARVNETPSTETTAVPLADGADDNKNNNEEKKLWFGLLPGDFAAAGLVVTAGLGKGYTALVSGVLCGTAYILGSNRVGKVEEKVTNMEKTMNDRFDRMERRSDERSDRLEHLIMHGSLPQH